MLVNKTIIRFLHFSCLHLDPLSLLEQDQDLHLFLLFRCLQNRLCHRRSPNPATNPVRILYKLSGDCLHSSARVEPCREQDCSCTSWLMKCTSTVTPPLQFELDILLTNQFHRHSHFKRNGTLDFVYGGEACCSCNTVSAVTRTR